MYDDYICAHSIKKNIKSKYRSFQLVIKSENPFVE